MIGLFKKQRKDEPEGIMQKRIINLPREYSQEEIKFINDWYSEEGVDQFKQSHRMECIILDKKPPQPGCKYVQVGNIRVNFKVRNPRTLELENRSEHRIVTLLLMDRWIK